MWLTLLFAAFDDALGAASRKAARHEMKGRLFPVEREPRPAAWQTFFEFFAKLNSQPDDALQVNIADENPIISVNYFVECVWMDVIGGPGCPHYFRSIIEDGYREQLGSPGGTTKTRFSIERTEFDPLFRIALWEMGEKRGWRLSTIARSVNPSRPSSLAVSILQSLPSARDWVQMTHPDLTGMTWTEILTASNAWHATLQGVGFRGSVPPALIIASWPDGWTMQRLTEKKDFAEEGTSMAHCIGGPARAGGARDGESQYWQAARDNKGAYFSLRNAEGVPEVTVEVIIDPHSAKKGKIIQVQGPNDKAPPPAVPPRLSEAITALDGWLDQSQQIRWDPERLPSAPFLGEAEVKRMGIRQRLEAPLDDLSAQVKGGYGQRAKEETADKILWAFAAIEAKRKDGYSSGIRTGSAMGPSRSLLTKATGLHTVLGYTLGCRRDGIPASFGLGVGVNKKGDVWLFVWKLNGPPPYYIPQIEGNPDLRKTQDPVEALRWFLDVSATPPDTSHITLFPGLKPDPSRSAWTRAIQPVALAREDRAIQSQRQKGS